MNGSTTRTRFRIRRRSIPKNQPRPKEPTRARRASTPETTTSHPDASAARGRAGFAAWAAATIFVSAFLLFQVQPLISKMILPWFGGSPMVWTTCLLFFQTLLLGGYAYAHLLIRQPQPRQLLLHLALLLAALLLLPITPETAWKPTDSSQPTLRIMVLLLAHVGLPYFLLSSTAPLVQTWYSRVYAGRSPYRLYALSNVSSMLALLSYPFVFEPAFDASTQGRLWALGFGLFAFLCGYLCLQLWRSRTRSALDGAAGSEAKGSEPRDSSRSVGVSGGQVAAPTWIRKLTWLALSAFASMLLLAVTNHVCQDVAVIPFLWIVPLSLYLFTFILCFDSESWYHGGVFGWAAALVILVLSVLLVGKIPLIDQFGFDIKVPHISKNLVVEAGLYFAVLFLVCMLCHGELVRRKPASRYLTSFYLMVAAGGALGGLFVAVVAPLIFSTFLETKLGLVGGYALALLVVFGVSRRGLRTGLRWVYGPALLVLMAGSILVAKVQIDTIKTGSLATVRNFYGVLRVDAYNEDKPALHVRMLYHGRIMHGVQAMEPTLQKVPTKYYNKYSGAGVAMRYYPRQGPWRVGVIGLGTGTMAAYGRPGDTYRFYEINPQVVDLSRRYFTYLENSPATIEIVLGDARLSMEREAPQAFDVLVLDAFSGDAIPVHLLTREAFGLYRTHLKEGGVLAVHISNRHLDLGPVVAGLAAHYGMKTVEIYRPAPSISRWMLVTENEAFLRNEAVQEAAEDGRTTFKPIRMWTDQYSNLFEILEL